MGKKIRYDCVGLEEATTPDCTNGVVFHRMHTKLLPPRFSMIDLFAGCGGLSLGMEQAGFLPVLFSELNLNAAETYMINRRGEEIIPIGDIYSLTDANLAILKSYWKQHRGIDDIDLVCGGPPCQGFSGIGHRRTFALEKKDIPSNQLFQEMARVIRVIRPKIFLFENVRGLLVSKWSANGKSGEIFSEVLKEFSQIQGYSVKWELIHAKDYGVPQNRPRVLVVGMRHDVVNKPYEQMIFAAEGNGTQIYNAAKKTVPTAVERGFLPSPVGRPPTMEELLSDLVDVDYLGKAATLHYPSAPQSDVQRMLRILPDGKVLGKGAPLADQEYSNHSPIIRKKFEHMIANHGEIPKEMRTKKFAQRVLPRTWPPEGPNITACSLPEDYVHYSLPRGPTVREWARIQTFPDWYVFTGARTTGGRRRAGDPSLGVWTRDVPRYTQVGNAVPVLLARCVGEHFAKILRGEVVPQL
jgi:DNA (cytosine-5)-methyltransferase 1